MLHRHITSLYGKCSHTRGSTTTTASQTWPMSGSPRGADFSPSQAGLAQVGEPKSLVDPFASAGGTPRGMPPTSRQIALAAAAAEAERRATSDFTFPFAAHEHDMPLFNHVRCPSRAAAEPWPVSDESPTREHAAADACVSLPLIITRRPALYPLALPGARRARSSEARGPNVDQRFARGVRQHAAGEPR